MLAALTLMSGCAGLRPQRAQSAAQLYQKAHKAMLAADWKSAGTDYQTLITRFPFAPQARQAQLDVIYVDYRKGDASVASDAADEFLRENPTNPRADYAWYMKGLINFRHISWRFEHWLGVSLARRPPTTARQAITAFNTVVTQYPTSRYAAEARQRMVYLRNRLAEYDVNVASYYLNRGAYVAAARRAENVLARYPGAPAERQALAVMIASYRGLHLKTLAANTEHVYKANFRGDPGAVLPRGKKWWEIW